MTLQSLKSSLEKDAKLLKYALKVEVWQSPHDWTVNFTSAKSNRSFCHRDIDTVYWMATGYIHGLTDGQT